MELLGHLADVLFRPVVWGKAVFDGSVLSGQAKGVKTDWVQDGFAFPPDIASVDI